MGFNHNASQRAAIAVNNADTDSAMNWLLQHLEDTDIDTPIPTANSAATRSGGIVAPPESAIDQLTMMGFDRPRCIHALSQTNNDPARAVEWLFSHMDETIPDASPSPSPSDLVSAAAAAAAAASSDTAPARYELIGAITHLGKSTSSGHYVAHILHNNEWILYNDQKVSRAEKENPTGQAYMLVFRRTTSQRMME